MIPSDVEDGLKVEERVSIDETVGEPVTVETKVL